VYPDRHWLPGVWRVRVRGAGSGGPVVKLKLGVGTYSFMWSIGFDGARPKAPMTARDLARKAVELGVGVVQFGPNLPVTLEDLSPARESGLEIELGAVGLDLRQSIELTRAAGGSFLRTVLREEPVDVPAAGVIEAGLRALVPVLDGEGVRLGLENSVVPAAVMRTVCESVGSPWVGVTLDTANSLVIGEHWRQVLDELAAHTFCLHLKDYTIRREWHRMGFRVLGTPAGEGDVDAPVLLQRLEAGGACRSVVLELWPPEQADLDQTIALEHEWAARSVAYLRGLMRE
jgi:3-oxoisoapionate decarboxylase